MTNPTTRRAVLTGAAAAAAVSLTSTRAGAQAPGRRFQPARHSQDEWLDTVPGKHRTFIDCASVNAGGAGILYANNLYVANAKGYQLKEADVAVVVCLRHFATVFAFNDTIWGKYGQALSDGVSFVDPKTKQAPSKNLLDDPAFSQLPVSTISSVTQRGTQFAVRLVPTFGREVGPEHRVVDVPTQMECEALLQAVDRPEGVLVPGLGQLIEGGVCSGDVGRMVLAVMQLHDLSRDMRLQCPVVVGQVRKCVLTHVVSFD